MTVRVLAVGNQNTDQVDHRSLVTALTQTSGDTTHRPGFFPSNPGPGALSNISPMTVGIGPFKAILPNQSGPGQFLVQSDGVEELTFDPGEPDIVRLDKIIVRVYNSSQDGSSDDEAYVEYLKGQSSGGGTGVPNGALLLWEVPVPAGSSSGSGGINFTSIASDKRTYTAGAGGIISVLDNTELDAIQGAFESMPAIVRSTNILYIHDGTSFRPHGQINVASSANLNTIAHPEDGNIAVTRDDNTLYVYNGSSWGRAALDSSRYPTQSARDISNITVTGTTPVPGSPVVGFTFVVPPSGSVKITITGNISSATNGNSANLGYEVRSGGTVGSGTVIQSASNIYAIVSSRAVNTGAASVIGASKTHTVTGLTAGSTYNVRCMHWIDGASGVASYRELILEPVI